MEKKLAGCSYFNKQPLELRNEVRQRLSPCNCYEHMFDICTYVRTSHQEPLCFNVYLRIYHRLECMLQYSLAQHSL